MALELLDFSDAPKSFTEMKGDKSGLASDWQPRDALIKLLREIDRGEIDPSVVIISYLSRDEEGEETVSATVGGKATWLEKVGLLEVSKACMT